MDIGLQTMKTGEKSIFILTQGSKNNKYIYEIELLKSEKHLNKYSFFERFHKKGKSTEKGKYDNQKYINISRKENIKKDILEDKNKFKKEKSTNKVIKVNGIKNLNTIRKKYGFQKYNEFRLRSYSPICVKCFRLIYISFDFIKNYISTKCSYCNKFDIYKYENFIEKIKKSNNPLLNSNCHKCFRYFNYSEKSFYLIEKSDYNFCVICEDCVDSKEYKEYYLKKVKVGDLVEHNLSIYAKGKNLDELKDLETKYLKNKSNIFKIGRI